VAKLIVHGANRNECLMRLRRTLLEFVVDGVDTTIPLHLEIIGNKDIVDGNYDIHWLEKYIAAKG
jgi:acetyl-CoA carboxylase biotin carboxylase subunit